MFSVKFFFLENKYIFFFSNSCSTLVPMMACLSPGTNNEHSAYPVDTVLIG